MPQYPIELTIPFKYFECAVNNLIALGLYNAAVALTIAAADCVEVYAAQAANHVLTLTISDDEIHVDCTKTL